MRRYITDEFRAPVSKALNNALRGVEVSNFQFVLFTKDGARVQVGLIAIGTLAHKLEDVVVYRFCSMHRRVETRQETSSEQYSLEMIQRT